MIHRIAPLLILTGLAVTLSSAQSPLDRLTDVQERVRSLLAKQSFPAITDLESTLGELQTLHAAPADVRERACRWLYHVLLKRGGVHEAKLRMRLIALRTVAVLAEDGVWAEKLMELALRGGRASLSGLDFWVERALGALRGRAHVARLLSFAEGEHRRARLLALGALWRRESDSHLELVAASHAALVTCASGDDAELAERALRVLGRIDRPELLTSLFAGARHEETLVRLAAVDALARHVRLPGVASFLSRLLTDKAALVREQAIVALRNAPDRTVVPLLVARLKGEPMRLRLAIRDTLIALTGFEFAPEHAPWAGWLRSVDAAGNLEGVTKVKASPYAPPPEYFDIPVLSDRLVFVVDVSGSMGYSVGDSTKNPTRMDRCKQELIRVLKALDERSRFNIIFFEQRVRSWSASGLVRATKRNKGLAIRAVQAVLPRGGTDSYGALEMAFKGMRGADTIYFLSDGVPSVGKSIVQEKILQRVCEWNRRRGTRIHSIALLVGEQLNPFRRRRENKANAARFMRILAEETGGTFRDLR